MRILTVRNPWAWAIIHGGKSVENRSRNLAGDWRGTIAIHVGLVIDYDAMGSPIPPLAAAAADHTSRVTDPLQGAPWFWNLGAIIGVVDLVDVHEGPVAAGGRCLDGDDIPMPLCSPWGDPGVKHLVLANPRPLSEPIPLRGGQGLRWVSPELQARIEEAS